MSDRASKVLLRTSSDDERTKLIYYWESEGVGGRHVNHVLF